MVEVELLQRLSGREAASADPALATVGLPGGDLSLQARGENLLMGPPATSAGTTYTTSVNSTLTIARGSAGSEVQQQSTAAGPLFGDT